MNFYLHDLKQTTYFSFIFLISKRIITLISHGWGEDKGDNDCRWLVENISSPALPGGTVTIICICSSLSLTFYITSSSVITTLFKSFTHFSLLCFFSFPYLCQLDWAQRQQRPWPLLLRLQSTSQGSGVLPTPSGLKFSTCAHCLYHFSQRSHFLFNCVF